jgi:Short C-terminal domain/zinc-ribbon family
MPLDRHPAAPPSRRIRANRRVVPWSGLDDYPRLVAGRFVAEEEWVPMVVIFGWGHGQAEDRGEVVPIVCPRCHNQVFLHEIKSDKQVSLFFVPLASYGTDLYLACPICHAGAAIDATHRPSVDSMLTATRAFRAGRLPADAYRVRAQAFLVTMGFTAPSVPAGIPPSGASPAPSPAASAASVLSDRLASLAKLHADGVLDDEEFSAAKRRLLES